MEVIITCSKHLEIASEYSMHALFPCEIIFLSTVAKGDVVTVDVTTASSRFIPDCLEENRGPYLAVRGKMRRTHTTACTLVFPIST